MWSYIIKICKSILNDISRKQEKIEAGIDLKLIQTKGCRHYHKPWFDSGLSVGWTHEIRRMLLGDILPDLVGDCGDDRERGRARLSDGLAFLALIGLGVVYKAVYLEMGEILVLV